MLGGGRSGGAVAARPLVLSFVLALLGASCTTLPTDPDAGEDGPLPVPTASPQAAPLRIATGLVATLDPAHLDSPQALLIGDQIFDGLVSYDPHTLEVVPALARRWETLEDGRFFRFHLREGLRFHDGTAIRAQDFVSAWTRIVDPVEGSPYAFLLEKVDGFHEVRTQPRVLRLRGVAAPDRRTLEVRLTEPWPDFVAVLGHPVLTPVPPGIDLHFGDRPVGTGPYELVSRVGLVEAIRLERFDGFYGRPAHVQEVRFRVFQNPAAAWPDFLDGELDIAPVPPELADTEARFDRRGTVTLGTLLYCGFNLALKQFQDRRLRVAVSRGIDRGALVTAVLGAAGVPATGIVPPSVPGTDEDVCGGRCTHDPAAAAEVAERVPRRFRTFHLDVQDSPVGEQIAALIGEQLAGAGIRVEARFHTDHAFSELFEEERHEFFCLTWIAEYPRAQALLEPLLLGGSTDNRTAVDDRSLNDLLTAARAEDNRQEREGLYQGAEQRALRLMPLVPLAWFRAHLAVQPRVTGFALTPLGRFDVAKLATKN